MSFIKYFGVLTMKQFSSLLLKNILTLIIVSAIGVCLIIHPQNTVDGIKTGFLLLGNNLIPSLFPFMILSSYISESCIAQMISKVFEKPFKLIFKTSGYGIIPFVLGCLGGYPVGAKTVCEFYESKKISQNDATRLLYWCINPSPAFLITAVGTFMLGNTKSGFLLYFSCLLSSVTIGFICRFLSSNEIYLIENQGKKLKESIFVKSVSKGSEGMLAICGWVLTFCVLSSLCDALNFPYSLAYIIKSAGEVTTGCKNAVSSGLALPVIAGIAGFGGFAVICQCASYSSVCKVRLKYLISSRLINAALSGIYCSALLKLFPQCENASVVISTNTVTFTLYHSIGAAIILIIMCALLILEVDNHKKVC